MYSTKQDSLKKKSELLVGFCFYRQIYLRFARVLVLSRSFIFFFLSWYRIEKVILGIDDTNNKHVELSFFSQAF